VECLRVPNADFCVQNLKCFYTLLQCLSRQEILHLLHRFSQNVMNSNEGKNGSPVDYFSSLESNFCALKL